MNTVCLIDTSVFLNLLNVPNCNDDKEEVCKSFMEYTALDCTFILPMATILETGNHIAKNGDGGTRRKSAKRFCDSVKAAFNGEAPWKPSEFPKSREVMNWIDSFPDLAGQNKSVTKTGEGTSFADLSIIQDYKKCIKKFSMAEIFIWSLDSDLKFYQYRPQPRP